MTVTLWNVRNVLSDEIREKAKNTDHPITLTQEQAEMLYAASKPPEFVNCGTVVVSLFPVTEGLVVIRRGKKGDDGYGKLGLIGGFQEGKRSEPVRQTAVREMEEETGIQVFHHNLKLINVETDDYRHNVIFFEVQHTTMPTFEDIKARSRIDPEEVLELVLLETTPSIEDVAFIFHWYEIRDYFTRLRR